MTITVISVGAKPPPNLQHQIDEYGKRLPASMRITWKFIAHSSAGGDAPTSKQHESEKILSLIPKRASVFLLDERGHQYSSQQFSDKLFQQPAPEAVCFIIGGAYGVNQAVMDRADTIWSLTTLVFPHQLVRVLLAEQLYRAYAIHTGHPYHHS